VDESLKADAIHCFQILERESMLFYMTKEQMNREE
jgi:hypothetical protein